MKASMMFGFMLALFAIMGHVFGEDMVDPMYSFYNGLAGIIDKNMDTPDVCVSQAEGFIKSHIKPLIDANNHAKKLSQEAQYSNMSEDEARKMMEKMKNMNQTVDMNRSLEALEKFTSVFQKFSEKYPNHAEKINNIFKSYQLEFE